MQKAWYVVEAYCATHLLFGPSILSAARGNPRAIALYLLSLSVAFFLAFLTYKGVRTASRALSAVIVALNVYFIFKIARDTAAFDVYDAYGLLVCGYFTLGAIKLWRIKELPTRFADPPAHT